jgi:hypothetical protein
VQTDVRSRLPSRSTRRNCDTTSAQSLDGRGMKCARCEDSGWVCENHPQRPWQGEHACECGGAGMPCPRCNEDDPPRLPSGFVDDDDATHQ